MTDHTVDPWTCPLHEAAGAIGGRVEWLSAAEAEARLRDVGPNRIEEHKRRHLLVQFLARFRNPLILVLLAAAAVAAMTGDLASFAIITTVVLLSVVLDFVQEHRAENAAEQLRNRVALNACVLRDGKPHDVPVTELVPGDIVLHAAGDLVPADERLIEARDLFVDEALLTGESFPAEKGVEGGGGGEAVPVNGIFAGSSVVSGTARALVIKTGRATRLGTIAHELRKEPPPTAFAVGIRDFGLLIVRLTVALVFFVLLFNLALERPLLQSFLFALALAVGLTPELLPMVVSVTLAHGALRMAEKKVIVKRLSAIHDLGSMDVLCSDKTGTLTEARIKLARGTDPAGIDSPDVLRLASVNATFSSGLRSPLDAALMEAEAVDMDRWRKLDEIPFNFERRCVSVLVDGEGRRRLIMKGAPEDVLRLSSHIQQASSSMPEPFDAAAQARARDVFEGLGHEGFRVLAIAWRDVEPDRTHIDIEAERDLVFAGFAAFLDPPKREAAEALKALMNLGIAVKVVTGDNERVTQHVCRELGIEITGTVSGAELAAMSDEALHARLRDVNLFCRVTPPQKARLIRALRSSGHIVGYLGDGINDAPSLHAADIGLSVESAVDVAKAAATMILLEKSLNVLVDGVREGRRTFANIMKYVMMGTSSNFGNMFSMALGVVFLPFLPMLPVQILLNNLLYDISEIAIPMDRVDPSTLARPRRWNMKFIRDFMLIFGPLSSVFDFATFAVLLGVFHADAALFRTAWFVESLATQVLVIFVIRTRGSAFASRPHPLLVATSLSAVAFALSLPFTPVGVWFGFTPLPPAMLAALALMGGLYLVVADLVKRWFYARHGLE